MPISRDIKRYGIPYNSSTDCGKMTSNLYTDIDSKLLPIKLNQKENDISLANPEKTAGSY
jgi:hypothetical protein